MSDFMTPGEAAVVLGITPTVVGSYIRRGLLPIAGRTRRGLYILESQEILRIADALSAVSVNPHNPKRRARLRELLLEWKREKERR